jgi:hypothetical protein
MSVHTSFLSDRNIAASQEWRSEPGVLDIGEAVAWIFNNVDWGQPKRGDLPEPRDQQGFLCGSSYLAP